jgi:hypothetical protein
VQEAETVEMTLKICRVDRGPAKEALQKQAHNRCSQSSQGAKQWSLSPWRKRAGKN